jgi:hypothetical protein
MGIIGIIGLILVLAGFSVMSKTSRIILAILLGGSLYYWQSISAVLHGGSGPNIDELKMAMTLLSANIGGFIIATILGVIKSNSTNEGHYQERKKGFFTFLVKWGLIYAIYSFICGKLIDWGYGEDGIGWFFMRAWGVYGFIAILVLWFIFKPGKSTQKK